jgi:sulfide:quinone oxidoreductase
MEIHRISDNLSVAGQVEVDEVGALAERGFRTIIVNRPDGEGGEAQPSFDEIAAQARGHGMEARYLPVVPGQIGKADVEAFASALEELPSPAFAFCRTGTRSVTLWALSRRGALSADEILKRAADAGYDLSELRDKLTP